MALLFLEVKNFFKNADIYLTEQTHLKGRKLLFPAFISSFDFRIDIYFVFQIPVVFYCQDSCSHETSVSLPENLSAHYNAKLAREDDQFLGKDDLSLVVFKNLL